MGVYSLFLVFVILLQGCIGAVVAQSMTNKNNASLFPKATITNTEVRIIHSAIVGQDYEITIALPKDYQKGSTAYGVIYATDVFLYFGTVVESYRILGLAGEMPPLVIVGIGYPSTSTNYDTVRTKVGALRRRDFTPVNVVKEDQMPPMRAIGAKTGGADKFLRFIKEELMPFVEKNYTVSTTDRTLIGYSYGGLFATYTLFHSPRTFSRYLIGSPSLAWGKEKNLVIPYDQTYASNNKELAAKVFLSVGSLEAEYTDNVKQAEKILRSRNYKGLTLKTHIFEGETHFSVLPGTISRGLHELYINK